MKTKPKIIKINKIYAIANEPKPEMVRESKSKLILVNALDLAMSKKPMLARAKPKLPVTQPVSVCVTEI